MLEFSNGGSGSEQSPSLSFYSRLRDDTAGALIAKFGRTGTLRQSTDTYDPSTGTNTESFTDTTIKAVILPSSSPNSSSTQGYSDDSIAKSDLNLLLSAAETYAASVIPVIGNVILLNSQRLRIVDITSVSTGGTDVMYKVGVSRG